MKKILITLLILGATITYAQNDEAYVDGLVSEFTETLDGDWFSNKRHCLGENKMFFMNDGSRCMSKESYFEVFIFWEVENKTNIKKFDSCGEYESTTFDKSLFVFDFKIDIKNKGVKKYEVSNPENKPTSSTGIYSCYRTFVFKSGEEIYTNTYNLYDLTNASTQKNINFSYNNDLKLVEIDVQIDAVIPVYDSSAERKK
ncbi:MAG: hypothetical protein ACI9SJ_000701 [Flavobacteriaceae bacterium]|jgi:hypothetical protein|uniref:hypothetical protein n=1 Tax=Candidatus Marifrigoribacter sp. Uisw_064 TaxID=3230970 RepID=UPI003AEC4815